MYHPYTSWLEAGLRLFGLWQQSREEKRSLSPTCCRTSPPTHCVDRGGENLRLPRFRSGSGAPRRAQQSNTDEQQQQKFYFKDRSCTR